ncbi:nickel pincer cofactor biosynthesis protein LarB [Candidatus Zixiibacteriota bacterium]
MRESELRELLEAVVAGTTDQAEAIERLRDLPFEEVGDFAIVDSHRELRCGFPEVMLGEEKTVEQCRAIAAKLAAGGGILLATRLDEEKAAAVLEAVPDAEYFPMARLVRRIPEGAHNGVVMSGPAAVVSAGTSDLPVAEEAVLTAESMGMAVKRVYDVGVAGIHRLLAHREELDSMAVVIVVAGMEGALPSVVGGMISPPIIAVPTSVGYGVSQGGFAALLGMLSSCASGVMVVNIDNGFGAGCAAARIARIRKEGA